MDSALAAEITANYLKYFQVKRTIGIDVQTLEHWETGERGIGRYTTSHIKALSELHPNWNFILFSKNFPKYGESLLNLPNVTLKGVGSERDHSLDLYHIPDQMSLLPNYIPPLQLAPKTIPCTILFHDVIPLVLPQFYIDTWPPEAQRAYRYRLEMVTASHAFLLTNSECTRRDAIKYAAIPEYQAEAIMAGSSAHENFSLSDKTFLDLKARLNLGDDYILYVGGGEEHKGLITVIQSWLNARSSAPNLQLVITGSANDPWKMAFKKHLEDQNVHGCVFTGFLSDAELFELYARARAFVFPSLYEGFGFPVLEAMSLGSPVISSNAASLPEVVGDAGVLLDPKDVDGFTREILAIDQQKRAVLSEKGKERAKEFTWKKVAEKTSKIWDRLIKD